MKRLSQIGSVAFVLLMLCSLLLAALPVYAEGESTPIDTIEVTVEPPLLGDDPTVVFSVTEDAPYTISCDGLWKLDNHELVDTIYGEATNYSTIFSVNAKEGYTLTADTTVTVYGTESEATLLGTSGIPADEFEVVCTPVINGVIDKVELTDIPAGQVGDKAASQTFTGEHYTAVGNWHIYDYEEKTFVPMDTDSILEDGGLYQFLITIRLEVGYQFDNSVLVYLDGTECIGDSYTDTVCTVSQTVSHVQPIHAVSVDEADLPQLKEGETFSKDSLTIPVPTDAPYTVDAYWFCDFDGAEEGTFEKGKAYWLNITFRPKAGYVLADMVDVTLGNEQTTYSPYDPTALTLDFRETLATSISDVTVTGLPTLKVGDTFPETPVQLTVPKDAPYTAYGEWCDSEYEPAVGKAKKGENYWFYVYLESKEGYEFSEDLIVKLDGSRHANWAGDPNTVFLKKPYILGDSIDKIEITTTKPEAGDIPSDKYFSIPKDAAYTVASVEWLDMETGDSVEKLEEGKWYLAFVEIQATDDYTFTEDLESWVDGELCNIGCDFAQTTLLTVDFLLGEALEEIRLEDVPSFAIGGETQTTITVPEDAPYKAEVEWLRWNEEEQMYEPFDGIFEEGESYSRLIGISAEEGTFFDDNPLVFLNGEKCQDFYTYGLANLLIAEDEFVAGLKEIDCIQLTMDPPVVGDHASVLPTVTITSGEHVSVADSRNDSMWLVGTPRMNLWYEGYFREGKSYGVAANFVPEDGYVFARDITIIVNNTVLSEDYYFWSNRTLNVSYFFDAECQHLLPDWETDDTKNHTRICEVCDEKITADHVFGDWIVCDKENHEKKCADCGYSAIEAHTYGEWQIGSKGKTGTHTHVCTVCEYVESGDHTYSQWTSADDDTEKRNCTVCGDEQTREVEKEDTTTSTDTTTAIDTTTSTNTTLSPDTGVKSRSWLWIVVAAAAAVCAIALLLTKKKD